MLTLWGPHSLHTEKDWGVAYDCGLQSVKQVSKKDVYPLLRIDGLLYKLSKVGFLSAIDLTGGYHQINLANDACGKTAFVTRCGLFEYTVLPLGLCNAPSMFRYFIDVVMSGYIDDFMLVYLDNILIYSDNAEEHETHLRKIYNRLCKHKLQAKLTKCKFGKPYVKYLGHIVGSGELCVDSDKVAAILDWEPPRHIKGVQ